MAKLNKVKGSVVLELTINSFGEIESVKLIRGIGYGCNDEAIRLVKQMPLFEPALYFGIPVESKLTREIRFPKPKGRKRIVNDFYKYNYGLTSRQLVNVTNFR